MLVAPVLCFPSEQLPWRKPEDDESVGPTRALAINVDENELKESRQHMAQLPRPIMMLATSVQCVLSN